MTLGTYTEVIHFLILKVMNEGFRLKMLYIHFLGGEKWLPETH